MLLKDGTSILDTVVAAGYFDQAHLTRSLKRFVGQTPSDIVRATEQLSFLYKTTRWAEATVTTCPCRQLLARPVPHGDR